MSTLLIYAICPVWETPCKRGRQCHLPLKCCECGAVCDTCVHQWYQEERADRYWMFDEHRPRVMLFMLE